MPLSAADVAILLIDIQPGIIDLSHTHAARKLRLASKTSLEIADLLGIPAFASVVATGPEKPETVSELAALPAFQRHVPGSFDNPELRSALAATGRKTLAIGGIVTEIAVLHGALTAIREGYTVHILADCCGGFSERTETAALHQLTAAGATISSVPSFFTAVCRDFSTPEGGQMITTLQRLMSRES